MEIHTKIKPRLLTIATFGKFVKTILLLFANVLFLILSECTNGLWSCGLEKKLCIIEPSRIESINSAKFIK